MLVLAAHVLRRSTRMALLLYVTNEESQLMLCARACRYDMDPFKSTRDVFPQGQNVTKSGELDQ